MVPKKKDTASGVITFHTHFPVNLLKSEECMVDVKDTTQSKKSPSQPSARTGSTGKCVRAGKRDESSVSGQQPGTRQERLSHTSRRRLQAKMEVENQQVKEIIQPLLDTENGFVKLERFLSQRDVTELRRRELLHKRWSERVWFPLQRRVEEHVSSGSGVKAKNLYNHYLHHCNTKGFVFLETYDLSEYNPFLLKKTHYFKLNTADLKDPLYLYERLREKRTAHSCEAGRKYKLTQNDRPLSESVTSQADILLQASFNCPVSVSVKTPAQDETERRKSSRLSAIPYHISAAATPDGRCHQSGCWLSRCGSQQQPASYHQSLPESK
ncbi:protein FAM228A isoform X2 [Micropterus dolomieu]|uniref:protein FAM228A isoform X2 n=1 Tax=Micropterus dolomieu TaxID=147949 RepID=UPI001E8CA1C0|nr:protein FAM228A isoform X2 [Micropterus dolomieu]